MSSQTGVSSILAVAWSAGYFVSSACRERCTPILAAGGDIRHEWDPAEALRVGDSVTGTRVLENLYEEMKDKPIHVDLDGLWTDLGVHFDEQELRFDEDARLTAIRRAITADSE